MKVKLTNKLLTKQNISKASEIIENISQQLRDNPCLDFNTEECRVLREFLLMCNPWLTLSFMKEFERSPKAKNFIKGQEEKYANFTFDFYVCFLRKNAREHEDHKNIYNEIYRNNEVYKHIASVMNNYKKECELFILENTLTNEWIEPTATKCLMNNNKILVEVKFGTNTSYLEVSNTENITDLNADLIIERFNRCLDSAKQSHQHIHKHHHAIQ